MMEMAFQYDYDKNDWIPCTDPALIENNIEDIPCTLLVKYTGDPITCNQELNTFYVFCTKHRELEKVESITHNHVISKNGCHFDGLLGTAELQLRYSDLHDSAFVPFRWRIFQREPSQPINIACDVIKGKYCRDGILRKWENFAISVNLQKRIRRITPIWNSCGMISDCSETDIDIPDIVVNTAIDAMRESIFHADGIRPSVLSQMKGSSKILAFAERPFDLNIVYLKKFFSRYVRTKSSFSFDSLFPYDAKDNYKTICNILEIKPPKSLRRAYTYNPYAIIWYMIFRQWNIRDINLMQKFFYLDDCISSMYLSKFYYDHKEKLVTRLRRDALDRWNAVDFYCRWLLAQNGEKKFLRWLYHVSAEHGLTDIQWDTLMAFHQYHDALSAEVTGRLLNDGLTDYVHDAISAEITWISANWQHHRIHYDEEILSYECKINDYTFRLLHNTKMLPRLGAAFNNCVATYRREVEDHTSIIVYVMKKKKYVACIEICNRNHVEQARGQYNQRLQGYDHSICSFWAYHKNLKLSNHDLSPLSDMELRDFSHAVIEAIPYEKSMEEMNLSELLDLNVIKIRRGYYLRLSKLLSHSEKHSFSAPGWMTFPDEKALLNYLFPKGHRIFDAAFKGNTEAMASLGFLYLNGTGIRQDYDKALHWLTKAGLEDVPEVHHAVQSLKQIQKKQMKEHDRSVLKALSLLRIRKRLGEFEKMSA